MRFIARLLFAQGQNAFGNGTALLRVLLGERLRHVRRIARLDVKLVDVGTVLEIGLEIVVVRAGLAAQVNQAVSVLELLGGFEDEALQPLFDRLLAMEGDGRVVAAVCVEDPCAVQIDMRLCQPVFINSAVRHTGKPRFL